MSAANPFIIVACPLPKDNSDTKDTIHKLLQTRISGSLVDPSFPIVKFDVPDGDQALKFGSFDNLIKLLDDLAKFDNSVEQLLRRMERQAADMAKEGEAVEFIISTQREKKRWDQYVASWKWDEAKYSKARQMEENLQTVLSVVTKEDEEVRNKTVQYNDLKSQINAISQRDGLPLTGGDLIDILTPENVKEGAREGDDFIYSETLTTVVCVVGRGGERDFLAKYETAADNVVPSSARKFNVSDKEGNTAWRVVLFKSATEAFRKRCRELGICTVRDFDYSAKGYRDIVQQRQKKGEELQVLGEKLKRMVHATFSDTLIAMMHLKAMRVFVEAVLRFGLPAKFACFMIKPNPSQLANLRTTLHSLDVFSSSASQFGSGYVMQKGQEDEGEEYWPYVSIAFQPLALV